MKSFFIGLQFLTRLKLVNQTEWDIHDFGKSVVTFPLVGLVIGAFMALIYWLLVPYIPITLLALLLVVFEFLFTGGLHADGFMDTCDGLFSGRDRERKLEIMKDSRVGSNGVVGFVFLTLLKWQLIAHVNPTILLQFLFFMPIISRYSLVLSIRLFHYARPRDGEGFCRIFTKTNPSLDNAYYLITGYIFPLALRHLPRFRNLNQFSFKFLYFKTPWWRNRRYVRFCH